MRVLLSTYGSRGDVEPMAGLAVALRALGAEAQVCAPPDFAGLLDRPACRWCRSARRCARWSPGRSRRRRRPGRRVAELVAARFDTVTGRPRGCDALVAAGLMPVAAGARAVAEKLGVRTCTRLQPAACRRRTTRRRRSRPVVPTGRDRQPGAVGPGRPGHARAVRRTAQPPPGGGRPAAGGQRPRPRPHRPPVAGGGPGAGPVAGPGDLDVVQTGAWILPGRTSAPGPPEAFLTRARPRCT